MMLMMMMMMMVMMMMMKMIYIYILMQCVFVCHENDHFLSTRAKSRRRKVSRPLGLLAVGRLWPSDDDDDEVDFNTHTENCQDMIG